LSEIIPLFFSISPLFGLSIRGLIDDSVISQANNRRQLKGKTMVKNITIIQDVKGTSYFQATTNEGTMARVNLRTLKDVLRWVYRDYHVIFDVKLGEVARRRYCPDA